MKKICLFIFLLIEILFELKCEIFNNINYDYDEENKIYIKFNNISNNNDNNKILEDKKFYINLESEILFIKEEKINNNKNSQKFYVNLIFDNNDYNNNKQHVLVTLENFKIENKNILYFNNNDDFNNKKIYNFFGLKNLNSNLSIISQLFDNKLIEKKILTFESETKKIYFDYPSKINKKVYIKFNKNTFESNFILFYIENNKISYQNENLVKYKFSKENYFIKINPKFLNLLKTFKQLGNNCNYFSIENSKNDDYFFNCEDFYYFNIKIVLNGFCFTLDIDTSYINNKRYLNLIKISKDSTNFEINLNYFLKNKYDLTFDYEKNEIFFNNKENYVTDVINEIGYEYRNNDPNRKQILLIIILSLSNLMVFFIFIILLFGKKKKTFSKSLVEKISYVKSKSIVLN